MIGRSGERGSGISVLAARHDDDDDDDNGYFTKTSKGLHYFYTKTEARHHDDDDGYFTKTSKGLHYFYTKISSDAFLF